MAARNPFSLVAGLKPRRNIFDTSYAVTGTCDFHKLVPTFLQECVPGDTIKIGVEAIVRFQPLVTPILHSVDVTIHYFFVSYRLLTAWTRDPTTGLKTHAFDWEGFITGGQTGTINMPLPRWIPDATDMTIGSLWDYFGFPILQTLPAQVQTDVTPLAFPQWAYQLIWYEYYLPQDLTGTLFNDMTQPGWYGRNLRTRGYRRDYFTAAMPRTQRGLSPALPMRGNPLVGIYDPSTGVVGDVNWPIVGTKTGGPGSAVSLTGGFAPSASGALVAFTQSAGTFNVNDMRLAVQLQKWMERSMRTGFKYTEFLQSHFGQSPSDARLDRPEYIGGMKAPVVVSEVLATSATDTTLGAPTGPQGQMAGHGLAADVNYIGSYHVQEYGLIMGLMTIYEKAAYNQGINRQWLRYSRYDFYFPEFAHLSEQGIYRGELYWQGLQMPSANTIPFTGTTQDSEIFGFVGRYDELRTAHDVITSEMRDLAWLPNLSIWHLGRQFANLPVLNGAFLGTDGNVPASTIRPFAVKDYKPIMYRIGNRVHSIRPMPLIAEPGLIDHF